MDYYPGIKNERAKNSDFSMKKERIATFRQCSQKSVLVEYLAEAGFYETGGIGNVRCFFCGGGLRDVQENDDPWILHARYLPDCEYLKQCIGEKYIINIQNMDEEVLQEMMKGKPVEKHLVSDQLIEDLNGTASKLLIEKGYIQEDIEAAILKARETNSSGELKAHVILKCLQEYETTISPSNLHATTSFTSKRPFEPVIDTKEDDSSTEQDRLLEENRDLKNRIACKICLDKDACIVFKPCGHMVSCTPCSMRQAKCAVCRAEITDTVRAYLA